MKHLKNWQRYALEWGVLAALILFLTGILGTRHDPEAYCPFGGVQALVNYISHRSLPCGMSTMQIFAGIALVVATVLFSKLFCAYLCPLGTVSDLLMKLRRHWNIKPLNIPSNGLPDKILRIIKYILLFLIIYNTIGTGELFCKRLDPYYAVATGFKGEISLYLSLGMLTVLLLFSFFSDNFWCRYICPLGALSNSLKYWLWMVTLLGVVYVASSVAGQVPAWIIVALFCIAGYLFEILSPKASMQVLNVQRDSDKCTDCKECEKKCPYHINVNSFNGTVESVDCMLCGECVENCPSKALHIGFKKKGVPNKFNRFLPALLTLALAACALIVGTKTELPTINEYWGLDNDEIHEVQSGKMSTLSTFTINGLSQVRCYASSMAFMEKLRHISGVHGVKTYVRHHRATILYKPELTTPEQIQQELFVPTTFQISRPDYRTIPELRVITIRTENMTRSNSVNLLGLQFKQLDSLVYGLETEWDTPMKVRMFVDPSFDRDEAWIREVVSMPYLELTNARTGKTTQMQTGYEFVRMEESDSSISTVDFLHRMFKPFVAEFVSIEDAPSKEQYLYEIVDKDITKPVFSRKLPILASYLSLQDGVGSVYTCLNDECIPEIVIRFYPPMTEEKIEELLSAGQWTIRRKDGISSIEAPVKLKKGSVRK